MVERVLLTGASGFIGSSLMPPLQRAYSVTATARSAAQGFTPLDITDAGQVRKLVAASAPDVVVHLAAIAHQPTRSVGSGGYDSVNRAGLVSVLDAALERGCRRFVFVSSASVYGDVARTGPVGEDEERRPVGPYAESKAAAEDACFKRIQDGAPVVILRPPAVYARDWLLNVRKRAYVPGTRGRVLLTVPGRQPRYSLCAIDHLIQAVLLGLRHEVKPGAYNVCDPRPYAQREIAAAVGRRDGVGRTLPVPRVLARALLGAGSMVLGRRGAGLRNNYWKLFEGLVLDTGKIREAGLEPTTDLHRALDPSGIGAWGGAGAPRPTGGRARADRDRT